MVVYPFEDEVPPLTVSVSVNNGVPVPVELPKRLNVTVPVGLKPPLTVALSAIELPTMADAGCWLVFMLGVAAVTVTGSEVVPLVTALLLLLPLYVATQ